MHSSVHMAKVTWNCYLDVKLKCSEISTLPNRQIKTQLKYSVFRQLWTWLFDRQPITYVCVYAAVQLVHVRRGAVRGVYNVISAYTPKMIPVAAADLLTTQRFVCSASLPARRVLCIARQLSGRAKKLPLRKIRYLWNCSSLFLPNLAYSAYRGGFGPHILQISFAILDCIQKL